MTLYTKSINAKIEKKDGIRICVMRYLRDYYKFDAWIPALAPSKELLNSYHARKISWDEYVQGYNKVLQDSAEIVKILSKISNDIDITLLCWERMPEKCHRRLIVEECKKYNPRLKVVLN